MTPTSTLRQSIPAAYLTVYVKGTFDIDIYVDVNGQWVSGDRGSAIKWELNRFPLDVAKRSLKTWAVRRQVEQTLAEYNDRAEWGTLHFTAPDVRSPHTFGNQHSVRKNADLETGRPPRVWNLCSASTAFL